MSSKVVGWLVKALLLILGVVFGLDLLAHFIAEFAWFKNLGYLSVFQTQLAVRIGLWIIALASTGGYLVGNLVLARRWRYHQPVDIDKTEPGVLNLTQLLLALVGLSLLLASLLTHIGQVIIHFWYPPTEIATSSSQILQQFTFSATANVLKHWLQMPWQLLLVAGFTAFLLWHPGFVLGAIALCLSLGLGLVASNHWTTILAFIHATPFKNTDPLFGHDIGFYVFVLPLWELLRFWLMGVTLTGFVSAALIYLLAGDSVSQGRFPGFTLPQKRHLYGLGGALALTLAWGFWLDRYSLLYSTQGILYGAGYTDVTVDLPTKTLLCFGAATIAVVFFGRAVFPRPARRPVKLSWILSFYVGIAVVAGLILPRGVQALVVQPNELAREESYIEKSIQLTRAAFDLDNIETKTFQPKADLTPAKLKANDSTLRNIRLWDTRPLLEANRQLQRIRLYYEFPSADVDRYTLKTSQPADSTGEGSTQSSTEKRQVLVAARELDYGNVPPEAQTWINQRLIYTHGYGFTLSPVNTAETSGLPTYFVKDIGAGNNEGTLQTATSDIAASIPINLPRIYFGELSNTYVMTRTKVQELDYPSGNDNRYNTYDGTGGVAIGSWWRRGLFSLYLRDWQMLFTQNFTPQTEVLYRRQIKERVEELAPFLRFDSNPYLVTANVDVEAFNRTNKPAVPGTLFWVIDAYTVSNHYPYSDPGQENFNYIRNSVKVVIDAYNGSVTFYSVDLNDPILKTWRGIFPQMFQPLAAMPPSLRSHTRYPTDLFRAQSQSLLTYHMTDPQVFYNREDQWRVPNEIYGEKSQLVQPYYLTMKLPEADTEEFILLYPFTPVRRNNLIAWLAARSDGENYGKRLLYQFPKRELIFGPEQIEALINQDPVISQRISLWNRQGSRVIQGNLLIIPIEDSLLYVEPLYLEAEENSVPILARVIVVYENKIVMAKTLDQGLAGIFQTGDQETEAIVRPVDTEELAPPPS
ncbi:UPF0182 family protein [Acaryochloris marina NIES-2412]|uniref:UPF0182 family protein n=1 Tax=Acaryochloris marina TaxID=155978 RepID=UPI0040596F3C